MKRLVLLPLVLALIMVITLTGCSYSPIPPRSTSQDATPAVDSTEVYYGNDVYGLPYDNAPNVMAAFLHRHPDLRVTAVYSAAENGGYGRTSALMVITEQK